MNIDFYINPPPLPHTPIEIWGRNVQVAKRPVGAKRPGGETFKGGNGFGAKRPGTGEKSEKYATRAKSRKENPQKLTQLSSKSIPRHLVGKRTAQKDITIDTTSDSQVNSNFPNRWSPASLTFNNYFTKFHEKADTALWKYCFVELVHTKGV